MLYIFLYLRRHTIHVEWGRCRLVLHQSIGCLRFLPVFLAIAHRGRSMSRIVCFADVDVAELYLGCCAVPHPLSGSDRSLPKRISCVQYSKTEAEACTISDRLLQQEWRDSEKSFTRTLTDLVQERCSQFVFADVEMLRRYCSSLQR